MPQISKSSSNLSSLSDNHTLTQREKNQQTMSNDRKSPASIDSETERNIFGSATQVFRKARSRFNLFLNSNSKMPGDNSQTSSDSKRANLTSKPLQKGKKNLPLGQAVAEGTPDSRSVSFTLLSNEGIDKKIAYLKVALSSEANFSEIVKDETFEKIWVKCPSNLEADSKVLPNELELSICARILDALIDHDKKDTVNTVRHHLDEKDVYGLVEHSIMNCREKINSLPADEKKIEEEKFYKIDYAELVRNAANIDGDKRFIDGKYAAIEMKFLQSPASSENPPANHAVNKENAEINELLKLKKEISWRQKSKDKNASKKFNQYLDELEKKVRVDSTILKKVNSKNFQDYVSFRSDFKSKRNAEYRNHSEDLFAWIVGKFSEVELVKTGAETAAAAATATADTVPAGAATADTGLGAAATTDTGLAAAAAASHPALTRASLARFNHDRGERSEDGRDFDDEASSQHSESSFIEQKIPSSPMSREDETFKRDRTNTGFTDREPAALSEVSTNSPAREGAESQPLRASSGPQPGIQRAVNILPTIVEPTQLEPTDSSESLSEPTLLTHAVWNSPFHSDPKAIDLTYSSGSETARTADLRTEKKAPVPIDAEPMQPCDIAGVKPELPLQLPGGASPSSTEPQPTRSPALDNPQEMHHESQEVVFLPNASPESLSRDGDTIATQLHDYMDRIATLWQKFDGELKNQSDPQKEAYLEALEVQFNALERDGEIANSFKNLPSKMSDSAVLEHQGRLLLLKNTLILADMNIELIKFDTEKKSAQAIPSMSRPSVQELDTNFSELLDSGISLGDLDASLKNAEIKEAALSAALEQIKMEKRVLRTKMEITANTANAEACNRESAEVKVQEDNLINTINSAKNKISDNLKPLRELPAGLLGLMPDLKNVLSEFSTEVDADEPVKENIYGIRDLKKMLIQLRERENILKAMRSRKVTIEISLDDALRINSEKL